MSDKTAEQKFDPSQHLIELSGKDYLPVAARLIWFRSECPQGEINTEAIHITDDRAIFKATIKDGKGGLATGWRSEKADDFEDGSFVMRCETGAIGRALAALGYGTQFCEEDLKSPDELLAGRRRIVDSPVERGMPSRVRSDGNPPMVTMPQTKRQESQARRDEATALNAPENQKATERQVKFIYAIAREAGLDEQELGTWSQELYAKEVDQLNRRDASALIEAIQRRRNEVV